MVYISVIPFLKIWRHSFRMIKESRGDSLNSPSLSEIHIFEDALDIGLVLKLCFTISTAIEAYSVDNFRENNFLLVLWLERIHPA